MEQVSEQMSDIEVLVCDDSALMRNLISRIVDSTSGMKTVATAMNGKFALEKVPQVKPDAILLDIEMPEMNGVEFLRQARKQGIDTPVIILSSIATKGAAVTIECLELGASDFITKPNGSISTNIADVSAQIVEKISSYGGAYARFHGKNVYPPDFFNQQIKLKEAEIAVAKKKEAEHKTLIHPQVGSSEELNTPSAEAATKPAPSFQPSLWKPRTAKQPAKITPLKMPGKIDIIAIGISTGGPNALREVFADITPDCPVPILVVQHMPAGFTKEFAASLNKICPLTVTEATDMEKLEKGHVYIAPGDWHIYVEKMGLNTVVRTCQDELCNGHRPSADVLFESVAKVYQNHALGVIMTGMGRDGALKITEMRKQGAWTLGQDEKSSIVYGMPRVAWELGGVQKQVPLSNMAAEINKLIKEHCEF